MVIEIRRNRGVTSRKARGTRVGGALLLVAAISGLALQGRIAHADSGRSLTVSPATGLGNQVVLAEWTGFKPTSRLGTNSVTIVQCKNHAVRINKDRLATTVDDCLTLTPYPNN